MSQEWGRNQYAGEWPNPKAAWTIAIVLLAVASVAAICAYRYAYVLTPLQRFYLKTYVRSGLRAEIGISKTDRYVLLNVMDRHDNRLALNEGIVPVTTATGLDVPILRLRPMTQVVSKSVAARRFQMSLALLFGLRALSRRGSVSSASLRTLLSNGATNLAFELLSVRNLGLPPACIAPRNDACWHRFCLRTRHCALRPTAHRRPSFR